MSFKIILIIFSFLITSSLELQSDLPNWFKREIYEYAYARFAQIDDIVPKIIKGRSYAKDNVQKVVQDFQNISKDYHEFRQLVFDSITPNLRQKLSYDQVRNYFEGVDYVQKVWYLPFLNNLKSLEMSSSQKLQDLINQYLNLDLLNVRHKLLQISNIFLTRDLQHDNLLDVLSKDKMHLDLCVSSKSIQQLIIDLFTIALEAYFKKTVVAYYCYTLRESINNVMNSVDKHQEIEDFKHAVEDIYLSVANVMPVASRQFWSCATKNPVKGLTFENMDQVFQIFFPSDRDMNVIPLHHRCSDLHDKKLICESDECKNIPVYKRCTGIIKDCENFWGIYEICFSDRNDDERIYDWISYQRYTNYTFFYYGDTNVTCYHKIKPSPPKMYGANHLGTCKCTCENDRKHLNRYFSLVDANSDFTLNKIITGVRFVKISTVFYIQIQQGTLGPHREIIDKPVWKDVDIIPNNILYSNRVSTVNQTDGGSRTEYKKNNLVYAVNGKQNLIFLNDLQARPNTVLTGIGLEQVGDALQLEIRDTPFDYKTGKLRVDESLWHHSEKLIEARTEVKLEEKGHPVISEHFKTISNDDQYIRFTTTGMKADVGQTVIPYIDLQPVMIYNPRPMTGAGLFYKGNPTTGGFLSLKLFHCNYAEWE